MRRNAVMVGGAAVLSVLVGCSSAATPTDSTTAPATSSAAATSPATGTATASGSGAGEFELIGMSEYGEWTSSQLTESSGLAYLDSSLLTVNDSGDPAVVYVCEGTAGEVTGTITYASEDPYDVEAITVGADRTVYVGDVGDNAEVRSNIAIYTFTAPDDLSGDQSVTSTKYVMTYPDGAHNAEAILVHPKTQEVFVVTKATSDVQVFTAGVLGSDKQIALEKVETGELPVTVTDGTFSPSGEVVLLRNYLSLAAYSAKDWSEIGTEYLPLQPQGEGLSTGPDGTYLIGSEKVGSTIWQFKIAGIG